MTAAGPAGASTGAGGRGKGAVLEANFHLMKEYKKMLEMLRSSFLTIVLPNTVDTFLLTQFWPSLQKIIFEKSHLRKMNASVTDLVLRAG